MKNTAEKNRCKKVFVISSMAANGAERVMSLLANRACECGEDVYLVLVSKNVVEYDLDSRIHICFAGANSTIRRIRNLRTLFNEIKPNIVLSFLTTCNMYCCIAAIGTGIPVIVSERNDPLRDCPSRFRRIIRDITYRQAKGFIFQTDEAASYFKSIKRKERRVIPNPVKDHLPFAEYSRVNHEIVAAGRLTEQKNYPILLEAFSLFTKNKEGWTLTIYGDGEERERLEHILDDKGLNKSVRFMGGVKDLHERIKSASMYVLSSDYEGISNSLLEAMAMGLPCISTDCPCGGSRHLIKNGENGLLVPVGDAKALAEAMSMLAYHPETAQKYGERAKMVRESHSEETIIGEYFEFMNQI